MFYMVRVSTSPTGRPNACPKADLCAKRTPSRIPRLFAISSPWRRCARITPHLPLGVALSGGRVSWMACDLHRPRVAIIKATSKIPITNPSVSREYQIAHRARPTLSRRSAVNRGFGHTEVIGLVRDVLNLHLP